MAYTPKHPISIPSVHEKFTDREKEGKSNSLGSYILQLKAEARWGEVD